MVKFECQGNVKTHGAFRII